MHGERFDPNGVLTGEEFTLPAFGPLSTFAPQYHDTVALADGGYLIAKVTAAMSSYTKSYSMYPIHILVPVIEVLRFGSDGAFVRAWEVARGKESREKAIYLSDPSLTALSDGNFLVTWHSDYFAIQKTYGSSFVSRPLDDGRPGAG